MRQTTHPATEQRKARCAGGGFSFCLIMLHCQISRGMKILSFFRKIKRKLTSYSPSVEVLISATNLKHNLAEYQKHYPELEFAPVLKSNAYGHGLLPVAKILDQARLPFFVVDSLHEAMILRQEGVRTPILVIGYTSAENIKNSKLKKVAFTITSLEQLTELAKIIKTKVVIHLKIDTGMHRQGLLPAEIGEAITILKANQFLELRGVCSHLADADNPLDKFTREQIAVWEQVVKNLKSNFPELKYFHLANTAGVFYANQISANVIRLGLGLYGFDSAPHSNLNLKPVLSLKTVISSIREVPANEFVGYNATYQAAANLKVATIPVGYFEGIDRRLSNCGYCQVKNVDCLILGRVSMNITSIDVSSVPEVKLGQSVTVISDKKGEKNSVLNIAKLTGTIPWEILVHIPAHLRRRVLP